MCHSLHLILLLLCWDRPMTSWLLAPFVDCIATSVLTLHPTHFVLSPSQSK